MKVIPLKQLGEKGKAEAVDYKILLTNIIQSPEIIQTREGLQSKGLTIEEVRRSNRILNVLEEAKENLLLEDADYQYLEEKVKKFRYGFASKNLETFIDDMLNAQEKKVEVKKE